MNSTWTPFMPGLEVHFQERLLLWAELRSQWRSPRLREAFLGSYRFYRAWHVHHLDRVRGAPRTTVYDNRIRCDNVQHGLMAVLQTSTHSRRPAPGPGSRRLLETVTPARTVS